MDSDPQFQQDKAEFDQIASLLIRQRISAISYYELPNESNVPGWNYVSSQFHIVDFGVEFTMDSGKVFSLIWDNVGLGFGLSIREASLRKALINAAVWNVSHDPSWALFTYRSIQHVNVYWAWWQTPEHPQKRFYYPQDLEILFDNESRIFIGVYVYLSDKTIFPSGDELMIFFDPGIAQTYLVGPYNPNNSRD